MQGRRQGQLTQPEQSRLENLEGQIGFRIKKSRLGIIQKSVQCATLNSGVTSTLRTAGMPAGSPQDLDAPFPTVATTMVVSSTSINDTLLGTGARKIKVQGLNGDWDMIEETLNMSGRTGSTTQLLYLRINKIFTESVGSLRLNEGDLYISATGNSTLTLGIPANTQILRAMLAGTNFDTFGIFSVPSKHQFLYQMLNSYSDATQTKPILLVQESIIPNTAGDERIRFRVGNLWQTGDISWDATGSLQEYACTDMIFSCRTNTSTATLNYYNEYCLIPDSLVATHG